MPLLSWWRSGRRRRRYGRSGGSGSSSSPPRGLPPTSWRAPGGFFTTGAPEEKVRAERRLWLVVLRAQGASSDVVAAYERVIDQVDLASIAARERVTRHDVKARIEEFN